MLARMHCLGCGSTGDSETGDAETGDTKTGERLRERETGDIVHFSAIASCNLFTSIFGIG